MQNCGGPSGGLLFVGEGIGSIMSDIAQLWSKYVQIVVKKDKRLSKSVQKSEKK
jgi:hypothetical protein